MKREEWVARLGDRGEPWDVCVIGGGASGLGIALDSASRGFSTLLVERGDFGQGTSSRSTKLIHGGVRYLEQGEFAFVREALLERDLLRRNAPHLVRRLPFIVPNYAWWEGPYYGIGMKVYEALSGKRSFGPSRWLSRHSTLEAIPTLLPEGLRGGIRYYDGQFDDARLAIALAMTAAEAGAMVLNHCEVVSLVKETGGRTVGAVLHDLEAGGEHEIRSRVTINATGPFSDSIRRMDDPRTPDAITPSQGIHIVLDSSFLRGGAALLVPRVEKGRVLCAIPWLGRTVIGTTDTPLERVEVEPKPLEGEIDFVLETAARFLNPSPTRADIRSVFAGIRPLVRTREARNTAGLSRDHTVLISPSGLVTLLGGKWTTYRKMAEDCLGRALASAQLEARPCRTRDLPLHGWLEPTSPDHPLEVYGSDAPRILELARANPELAGRLHPDLPATGAEIVWGVRHEMARKVEDVLSRRTRCLVHDARAAWEVAPEAARLMARELDRDAQWEKDQVTDFRKLAEGCFP